MLPCPMSTECLSVRCVCVFFIRNSVVCLFVLLQCLDCRKMMTAKVTTDLPTSGVRRTLSWTGFSKGHAVRPEGTKVG